MNKLIIQQIIMFGKAKMGSCITQIYVLQCDRKKINSTFFRIAPALSVLENSQIGSRGEKKKEEAKGRKMNYPTLDQLVQSGVHFGHRASRWNPKMKPFIFATRNSIHIINLEKTQEMLKGAMEYLKDVTAKGGTILFVGTKRQARNIVKQAAQSCGMPYVTVRWLGGTFTNFRTIQKTIRKLEELYHKKEDEDYEAKYTKKERLTIDRQIQKMETFFEGIKTMKKLPDAIFVVDINHEKIAVREAANVGVKVVAITDTNVDPENVNYLIPANDDATKSISLIVNLAAEAVKEGRGSSPVVPVAEKTADTEKNLKA